MTWQIISGGIFSVAQQERQASEAAEAHEEALARRWPWLLPLAAGIFFGAAVFEVFPDALERSGSAAWLWAIAGLVAFILVRDGLDYIGRHGLAWVATLGIWMHSFLEGAVTAAGYGVSLLVGLLVTTGLILHLIPELGAIVVLLTAAGLTLRDAVIRDLTTFAFLIVGFLVVYFFLPDLSPQVLGAALGFGAGGFLYLAYLSWREHHWTPLPSLLIASAGAIVILIVRVIAG